jgi:hypothetical protein
VSAERLPWGLDEVEHGLLISLLRIIYRELRSDLAIPETSSRSCYFALIELPTTGAKARPNQNKDVTSETRCRSLATEAQN